MHLLQACPSLHAHCSEKNVTFSETRRGCRNVNQVNTLGVTKRDPPFEISYPRPWYDDV